MSRTADRIYLDDLPLLRRIAIRKFNVPPADADALVHDVFVSYLVSVQRVTNPRSYLVGSICNASRNYWRSRRSEGRVFAQESSSFHAHAASNDLFDGLARNLIVASTLSRLAPRCREVLRRYYLDGEDTATIAAAMGTTPSNVNYMMHVCRKRARAIYEMLNRVS